MIILSFLFGANIHSNANVFLLFLIPLLVSCNSLGFGLLLASIVKTASSADGLAWFIILPLQFLGGLLISPDAVFLEFLPTALALRAMTAVMTGGSVAFEYVGLNLIFLSIWGICLILLGIILFQRKTAIL